MDKKITDPVILDQLQWLKEHLPPDVNEELMFKKVRRVQKVFDLLMGLSFEEFYKQAMNSQNVTKDDCQTADSLEELVDDQLKNVKSYIAYNEDKQIKSKKLDASRNKLELKKQQYNLITSIKLDGCMDLISRYNHLMSKK